MKCAVEEGSFKETLVGTESTTFLSIDIEKYEKGTEILEVGLAWHLASQGGVRTSCIVCKHLIIEEHLHLQNGKYVADNRDKLNWGTSHLVSLTQMQVCGRWLWNTAVASRDGR